MTRILKKKTEYKNHINNHIQDILPEDIDYNLEDNRIRMNWVVHTLVVAAAELVDPIEELPSQVLEVMQTEQEVTVEQDQVVIELSSEIKIKK